MEESIVFMPLYYPNLKRKWHGKDLEEGGLTPQHTLAYLSLGTDMVIFPKGTLPVI